MAAGLGAQWHAAQPQVWHADHRELEDPEPRRRDQSAPLRIERRFTLNTLMIGAPLTAAFVGLMAADDGVASGDAGGAEAEGGTSGARADGARAEPGQSTFAAPPWDGIPTGSPGPLLDLDGSARAEVSGAAEPVSTGDLPASETGIEVAPVQIPVQRAAAEFGAEAAGSAGPQLSLTFVGVQAFGPLEDPQVGEPVPPERGPIGNFVPGTDGGDVTTGTDRDDVLLGGGGDDELRGLAGEDILGGGTGNDRVFGGAGDDRLLGGEGDDELHGGTGNDRIFGDDDVQVGASGDLIFGGSGSGGDDRLFGGGGDDELHGGAGDDLLDGGAGSDRMVGGPGDDILMVDNIHDVALGDGPGVAVPGNNTLIVQDGYASHLLAELGEERATFVFSEGLGENLLPAALAEHRQQVAGDIQNVTLQGTADHDVLGDSHDNVIRGNAGDNTLYGRAGDDVLLGGRGADELHGGAGADELRGGAGDDILFGGGGDDELVGGAGDDILEGGTGEDRLFGGAGDDTYVIGLNDGATDSIFDHEGVNHIRLEGAEDSLVQTALIGDQLEIIVDSAEIATIEQFRGHEEAFAGIDFGQGMVPISELLASDVPEEPEEPADSDPDDDVLDDFLPGPTLGIAGNNVLEATPGADELFGTSGDDWLRGNAADDLLEGNAGNDVLEGGPGQNILAGGPGHDLYLFRSGDGVSTIRDTEGQNVAELEGFSGLNQLQAVEIDGNLLVVGNAAPMFEVENFVGNEQAFAGVWVGEEFVGTEQLVQGWQPG